MLDKVFSAKNLKERMDEYYDLAVRSIEYANRIGSHKIIFHTHVHQMTIDPRVIPPGELNVGLILIDGSRTIKITDDETSFAFFIGILRGLGYHLNQHEDDTFYIEKIQTL